MTTLKEDYPWMKTPMVSCAPMRLIATAPLAVAVSKAGGIGFLGAGSDLSSIAPLLSTSASLLAQSPPLPTSIPSTLPIGIGLLLWGLSPASVTPLISPPNPVPAATWLFAPRTPSDLAPWTTAIRNATAGATKVWIQIGTVAAAVHAVETAQPDVLVVQGQDAGGHGLTKGAGLVPLLPEVIAAVRKVCAAQGLVVPRFVAAGGIMDAETMAAALAMGAEGATLGTRFLAATEAEVMRGYREAVLRAKDGGVSTVRSKVYDTLRGTTEWPGEYGGRGVVNASFEDWEKGVDVQENKRLYEEAVKKGDEGWSEVGGRMTTYAGTGVGLVERVMEAAEIVEEVREGAREVLRSTAERWA